MNESWRGGASAFFHSGGGGRWREVLTVDDLALYEETKARVLERACASCPATSRTLGSGPAET